MRTRVRDRVKGRADTIQEVPANHAHGREYSEAASADGRTCRRHPGQRAAGVSPASGEPAGRRLHVAKSVSFKNACHSERSGVSVANGTQSRNLASYTRGRL